MSVNAIPVGTRLAIRYDTGLDPVTMNPIYRTRSYSRVKPDAEHGAVFTVAEQLSGLCEHTLIAIRRHDESELEEE